MATRKTTKSQIKRSTKTGLKEGRKQHPAALDTDCAARPESPSFEQIQLRAYEIFMARGAREGNDLSDWFEAEQQLLKGAGSRSN